MAARFLGWTPRDTATQLQNLARRTTAVTRGKYALVLLAFVLVVAVFAIPAFQDDTGGARIVFSNIQEGEGGKPVMSNPRYEGVDARKQPYVVSAKTAEQQPDGRVLLMGIEADITLANGAWFAFQAERGFYNPDKQKLDLAGKVQAFYEGYDMETSKLVIDLKAAEAQTTAQVNAQGPLGTLQAQGFRINQAQQYIQFTPDVTVKLRTKGMKTNEKKRR